jgi:AcrR family transcriptional regulator
MADAQRSSRDGPEVRRGQIVDEAIRAIGQRGYHGFTLQELAQRCGLTNGGVLYHFGSKERLLIAVIEEHDRREGEIIPASIELPPRGAPHRQVSLSTALQVFRIIVQRAAMQPELVRLYAILQAEALDPAHPASGYFLRREAMVLDVFTKLLQPHVAEPRSIARQIHALMDGLSLQWLRENKAFDMTTEWDRAMARLLPVRNPRRQR